MKRISDKTIFYLGIDPGAQGAVSLIDRNCSIVELADWPGNEIDAAGLIKEFCSGMTVQAAIEKVHAMPKQGVTSMFKFGANYGIWRGILAANEIPFLLPSPQQWQKGMLHKKQDEHPKMAAAARLFPQAPLYGPKGGRKEGRADALLIAYWRLRQA